MRKLRKREDFIIGYDHAKDTLTIFDKVKKIRYGATAEFLIKVVAKISLEEIHYED